MFKVSYFFLYKGVTEKNLFAFLRLYIFQDLTSERYLEEFKTEGGTLESFTA